MELFEYINIKFCLTLVLASYTIIKFIDANTKYPLSDKVKKICTYGVGIILYFIFIEDETNDRETLMLSYLVGTALYDFIIKEILKKYKINYNDVNNNNNHSSTGESKSS